MTASELIRIRKHLGFTQQQLAERLGINRVSVARMECGMRRITERTEMQVRQLTHSH